MISKMGSDEKRAKIEVWDLGIVTDYLWLGLFGVEKWSFKI